MNPVLLRNHRVRLLSEGARALLAASGALAQTLHLYGPGGPGPAMEEAVAALALAGGAKIEVVAGPMQQWPPQAKSAADLAYSGSGTMMTDFANAAAPQL